MIFSPRYGLRRDGHVQITLPDGQRNSRVLGLLSHVAPASLKTASALAPFIGHAAWRLLPQRLESAVLAVRLSSARIR